MVRKNAVAACEPVHSCIEMDISMTVLKDPAMRWFSIIIRLLDCLVQLTKSLTTIADLNLFDSDCGGHRTSDGMYQGSDWTLNFSTLVPRSV